MSDAVTSQALVNGDKHVVLKFTNVSDGTGESAVAKVAAATYGTNCRIARIQYDCSGMQVRILWDADTDVDCLILSGQGCMDFREFGGLANNGGTGVTGTINFTTIGHTSGDSYSIIMELYKK